MYAILCTGNSKSSSQTEQQHQENLSLTPAKPPSMLPRSPRTPRNNSFAESENNPSPVPTPQPKSRPAKSLPRSLSTTAINTSHELDVEQKRKASLPPPKILPSLPSNPVPPARKDNIFPRPTSIPENLSGDPQLPPARPINFSNKPIRVLPEEADSTTTTNNRKTSEYLRSIDETDQPPLPTKSNKKKPPPPPEDKSPGENNNEDSIPPVKPPHNRRTSSTAAAFSPTTAEGKHLSNANYKKNF